MLLKYRPEDKAAKKERLLKRAQAEAEGKTVEAKKPIVVKYGLNHVTYLIEQACSSAFRCYLHWQLIDLSGTLLIIQVCMPSCRVKPSWLS